MHVVQTSPSGLLWKVLKVDPSPWADPQNNHKFSTGNTIIPYDLLQSRTYNSLIPYVSSSCGIYKLHWHLGCDIPDNHEGGLLAADLHRQPWQAFRGKSCVFHFSPLACSSVQYRWSYFELSILRNLQHLITAGHIPSFAFEGRNWQRWLLPTCPTQPSRLGDLTHDMHVPQLLATRNGKQDLRVCTTTEICELSFQTTWFCCPARTHRWVATCLFFCGVRGDWIKSWSWHVTHTPRIEHAIRFVFPTLLVSCLMQRPFQSATAIFAVLKGVLC